MPQNPQNNALDPRLEVIQTAEGAPVRAGQVPTTLRVVLPAGSPGTPPHRHPGPVFGYLVRGAMRFEVEGKAPRTIREGEAFWEPGGDVVHYEDSNALADAETEFVVTLMVPPGEEILTLLDEAEIAKRAPRRVRTQD